MKKILRCVVGLLLVAGAVLATVSNPLPSVSYACNGVTAAFNVNFPYIAYTDLVVTSTTTPGVVTTLTYTTDFTVNVLSTTTSATATLTNPAVKCPTGSTLKIARTVPLTQPYSFKAQTTYNPALHETAYDRMEMQIQQVDAKATVLLVDAGTDYMTLTTVQTATGAKTFTGGLTSTTIAVNGNGITATGQGTGSGVQGTGGVTNGTGVKGFGTGTGHGVVGTGGASSFSHGVEGYGGPSGAGGAFLGGTGNSLGLIATAVGSGNGIVGLGAGSSNPASSLAGVIGIGNSGGVGNGVVGLGGGAAMPATSGLGGSFVGAAGSGGVVGLAGTGSSNPGGDFTGTSGAGLRGTGGTSSYGVLGVGGSSSGGGGSFSGTSTNGLGVLGTGIGSGVGVSGVGGATGQGGSFANGGGGSPVTGTVNMVPTTNAPSAPIDGDWWITNGATPVAGVRVSGVKYTIAPLKAGTCVLGTNCAAVALPISMICTCTDVTAIAACRVSAAPSAAPTFTGTGTDTIAYTCMVAQ